MKVLSLIFLFYAALPAIGQNCNHRITGVVTDSHTGERLPFAIVRIDALKTGFAADSNGYFTSIPLCNGVYTLHVSHIGCHPEERRVSILDGSVHINVQLDHSAHVLENVEIEAVRKLPGTGRKTEELAGESLAARQGENFGETLSRLPGITTLKTGAGISKPVIHGMHSNRILILNNGVRQEGQQWGLEHAPELDPLAAEKIRVIKGPDAIRYGPDAIAGIVLMEPALPELSKDIKGEISGVAFSNGHGGNLNLRSAFALPSKYLAFRLQGSLRRNGNLRSPDYFLSNTGLAEEGISAAGAYIRERYRIDGYFSGFFSKQGIFSDAHAGNLTDLGRLINRGRPEDKGTFTYKIDRPFQQVAHHLMKISLLYKVRDINDLRITFASQYNQREEFDKHGSRNDSLTEENHPEFRYALRSNTLDIDYKLHFHHGFAGNVGFQGIYQVNECEGRYFIPNYTAKGAGVYAIERYITGKLQLEAGMRVDFRNIRIYRLQAGTLQTPTHDYNSANAGLGAHYRLNDHLTVFASTGTAWRPPAPNELYSDGLHHGSAAIEKGNAGLGVEKAWNSSAGMQYEGNRLEFSGEVYLNRIGNYISLLPTGNSVLTIRGAFPEYHYVSQSALFKGLDARVAYSPFGLMQLTLQYSGVRATTGPDQNFIPQIPPDRVSISMKKEWKGKGIFQSPNLNLSVTHVLKQTRLPDSLRLNAGIVVPYAEPAPAPPSYTLTDLEFSCLFIFRNTPVTFSITAANLLNVRYRTYMNRFRYFAEEPGRNLSLRIKIPVNKLSKP